MHLTTTEDTADILFGMSHDVYFTVISTRVAGALHFPESQARRAKKEKQRAEGTLMSQRFAGC